MIVVLKPLKKNAWSGVTHYHRCATYLGPYLTRSGRRYTGLDKKDEARLSKELGIENLSPTSDFWDTFHIRIGNTDKYFDLDDPMDELRYIFLKNHRRVKDSLLDNKASADFVLINKDEEAKRSNLFNRVKREAMKEFDKLTPEDTRKCLRLFGNNAENMSNEVAENRLFNIVEDNPEMFLKKWVNNKTRETEFLIEQAVSRNIIRRNKNIYRYGTDVIAHGMQEAIDFLDDPKNQDIKIAILQQMESKASIKTQTPVQEEKEVEQVPGREVDLPETKAKSFIDETEENEAKEAISQRKKKGDTI